MINFPANAGFFRYEPPCALLIQGPDAPAFLQGQFSADLSGLSAGSCAYGLWLDRRGRVVADSHLVRCDSPLTYRVFSLASPAAAIRARLEANLVADEVEIVDETGFWQGFALVGDGVGEWLEGRGPRGIRFPSRRHAGESREWLVPAAEAAAALEALSGAAQFGLQAMELLRIGAGIPRVPIDIGPGELPHEGGLEAVAVSYSKGCYVGQEVMARLRTRGAVRRRLVRVGGPGPAPALPAALWAAGRPAGEIRSAVADGAGFAGLALVPVGQDGPLATSPGGQPSVRIAGRPESV